KQELPKEVRDQAELLVARMLIRGNKHEAARGRLEKMAAALPTTGPEHARVEVYLVQCDVAAGKVDQAATKLETMRKGDLDPAVKGLVYNALGDIALKKRDVAQDDIAKKSYAEEAFWDYLWVDVVYNQDRHEHAKALYELSKLFLSVKNDPARAQQCRDLLL